MYVTSFKHKVCHMKGEKSESGHSAVVFEHCQCIYVVGVHMCAGTNRKNDGRYYFGSDLKILLLSSWLCSSCKGQKQPIVEAKLLAGITAMMLIVKKFHKKPFSG